MPDIKNMHVRHSSFVAGAGAHRPLALMSAILGEKVNLLKIVTCQKHQPGDRHSHITLLTLFFKKLD